MTRALAILAVLLAACGKDPPAAPSGPPATMTLRVTVAADDRSPVEVSQIADHVRLRLAAVPGVREVKRCGGRRREHVVWLDPARLSALGLDAVLVAEALAARHDDEALEGFVLAERDGAPIRLDDVAVRGDDAIADGCKASADGRPVVLLELAVADPPPATLLVAVDAAVGEARAAVPPRVRVERRPLPFPRVAVTRAAPPRAEAEIVLEQARLADLGVDPAAAARTMVIAASGEVVAHLREGARETPVRLRLGRGDATLGERFSAAYVRSRTGALVPLAALARLEPAAPPPAPR